MGKIPVILFFSLSVIPGFHSAQTWSSFGITFDWFVRDIYFDTATSALFICGDFTKIDCVEVRGVAKFDGSDWTGLGTGLDDFHNGIVAPAEKFVRYGQKLIVCGGFTTAGGIKVNGIASWDGQIWDSLGSGTENNGFYTIYSHGGFLYAGGVFDSIDGIGANSLAKWDGNIWDDVGGFPNHTGNDLNTITAICAFENELYVGGQFPSQSSSAFPGNIARWDGIQWKSVGNGFTGGWSNVGAMTIYDEKLVIAGTFFQSDGNPGNHIVCWDGSNWNSMGGGVSKFGSGIPAVYELLVKEGILWVTGRFDMAGGLIASNVAKWNGKEWCSFDHDFNKPGTVIEAWDSVMLFAGNFDTINGLPFHKLAMLHNSFIDTACISQIALDPISRNSDPISIFPNPVTERLQIRAENATIERVSIYDLHGRMLYNSRPNEKVTVETDIEIDFSENSNGVYVVEVETRGGISRTKVVK